MLIVLDNVLDESRRTAVVNYFSSSTEARSMKWHPWGLKEVQADESPMGVLVQTAAKFFDLSTMVGCEYWAHYGTRPNWHVDKDESLKGATGEISCPLCSIVYYADIDVVGGAFLTETTSIKPVTNRMIIFSPGVLHGVEEYTGTRMAVAVNPWNKTPMGYLEPKTSEAVV